MEEMEGGDTAFYLEGIDVPPVPSFKTKAVNGVNGHGTNGIKA